MGKKNRSVRVPRGVRVGAVHSGLNLSDTEAVEKVLLPDAPEASSPEPSEKKEAAAPAAKKSSTTKKSRSAKSSSAKKGGSK